jgi:hypothetical protein
MYRGLGNKLHYLSLSLLNQYIKVYAFNSGNNKMYHLKSSTVSRMPFPVSLQNSAVQTAYKYNVFRHFHTYK